LKQSFYDLNYSDLEIVINQNNLNYSAAAVLFNWHYKKKESKFSANRFIDKSARI
jgi:23S rRNA (adenine2503-C2)-methyltransferase